jgi:hypothetical protein
MPSRRVNLAALPFHRVHGFPQRPCTDAWMRRMNVFYFPRHTKHVNLTKKAKI